MFYTGLVISGSYDETLKIWCLKTGRCEATLRGHQGRVLCMHVPWEAHPGLFLSGSEDKTIKVWSLQDRRMYLLKTLQGHENSVTTLSMAEGRKIISGSLDSTIKVWSLDSGLCLSTLDWMSSEGHTGNISKYFQKIRIFISFLNLLINFSLYFRCDTLLTSRYMEDCVFIR